MYLNQSFIMGHLGADATPRTVGDKTVIEFRMAATKKWKSGDELRERTEWFDVEYWPGSEDAKVYLLDNLKKGTKVFVDGEIRFSSFTIEAADGKSVKATRTKLVANSLDPLGRAPATTSRTAQHTAPEQHAPPAPPAAPTPIPASPPRPVTPAMTPVPIDPTLPVGHCKVQIRSGDFVGEMVAELQGVKGFIDSGQARLIAMGLPAVKPADPLPTMHAPAAASDVAGRPPLPSDDMIRASPGLVSEANDRPF